MAWSVFRFFPKTSVGFSRFEPNKAKNETEQFSVGFSVGSSRRFLVKPNEMVSVWKGSISLGWHDVRYDRICVSVACVCFHVKPFFLPVDIQQNQCLCRFFNTRRDTSSVVTNLRHRNTERCHVSCKHSIGKCDAM